MNKEIFAEQMRRLSAVFGDRAYPPERAQLILNEFKNEPDHVFVEVVTAMIAEHRSPPLVSDLKIERMRIREREAQRERRHGGTIVRRNEYRGSDDMITYAEYVRRCIDEDRKAEVMQLVKTWGMATVDELYKRGDAAKKSGVPDDTDAARMFVGKMEGST